MSKNKNKKIILSKNKKDDDVIDDIEKLEEEIAKMRDFSKDDLIQKSQKWEEAVDATAKSWATEEGELAVDIYQDDKNIIVKSAIGGVRAEDIDVSVDNGILTIYGERKNQEKIKEKDYFYQECYWGNFSRSIVLPQEVKIDKVKAIMENGLLTVILPKVKQSDSIKINVKEK